MKKSKLNKFETQKLINASTIYGGANNSDVEYVDSKKKGSWWNYEYDVVVQTLSDIVNSSDDIDKPGTP